MDIASIIALVSTAAAVALGHTAAGPDHYVPFIAMSRVGRWSLTRTLVITTLCGLGHVLSSVALGLLGVAFGAAVSRHFDWLQDTRGEIAGWMLLIFGVVYTIWGVRRALLNQPHSHWHSHPDGTTHAHEHIHVSDHAHVHAESHIHPHSTDHGVHARAAEPPAEATVTLTPWILFTIFVFGPCEPMIPLVMAGAARLGTAGVLLVTLVFSTVTIGTMLAIVAAATMGLARLPTQRLERFTHAAAGAAVAACGVAIVFLDL